MTFWLVQEWSLPDEPEAAIEAGGGSGTAFELLRGVKFAYRLSCHVNEEREAHPGRGYARFCILDVHQSLGVNSTDLKRRN